MILTGKQIATEVKNGAITIEPFSLDMVNPNSYNYRLGDVIYEVADAVIDPREPSQLIEHIIGDDGIVLEPNKLYLGSTFEVIGSSRYVTSLIGRSSMGRLGVFLQITADLGNLGKAHSWTLEIKVVQRTRLYKGMKIGQVSFWEVEGKPTKLYTSNYTNYSKPHMSKFHKELKS